MDRPFAVISGGSSGIGLALADRLGRRGFELALLARGAERLARAASSLPAGVTTHVVDVGEPGAAEAFAGELRAAGRRRLDLLVCNAGIPGRASALDVTPEGARAVMAVNYHGMVDLTRALWPELTASAGTVINVCSVAGTVVFPPAAPYVASKHAAVAWSRSLAAETRGSGVRVLTVNPGPVATDGFPQSALLADRRARRLVITAEACADAIVGALDRGATEIFVPRWWRGAAVLHALAPGAVARLARRARGASGSRDDHA